MLNKPKHNKVCLLINLPVACKAGLGVNLAVTGQMPLMPILNSIDTLYKAHNNKQQAWLQQTGLVAV